MGSSDFVEMGCFRFFLRTVYVYQRKRSYQVEEYKAYTMIFSEQQRCYKSGFFLYIICVK